MIDALIAEHTSRARRGARRQWNRLTPRMRRIVDLNDLNQEALIACWRAIVEYRPACGASLGQCISRRVACRLIDYLREQGTIGRGDGTSAPVVIPDQITATVAVDSGMRPVENRIDAAKALSAMGRDREVVRRWAHGATLPEIGGPLGITPGRICQIRERALKRARLVLRIAA